MHRTTILLPDDLKRRAAGFARQQGISLAELIREALEAQLAAKVKFADDPLFAALEPIDSDAPADLAANHDYYLYDLDD